MAATAFAVHRRANHAERPIAGLTHRLVERLPEARPTCPALELCRRGEIVEAAAGAGEIALTLFFQERAGERTLGRFLPQDGELLRRQERTPLRVGVGNLELLGALRDERRNSPHRRKRS